MLRYTFSKVTKFVYLENYEDIGVKIEEDTDKWKYIPCPWIEQINIVKMSYYPKASIDSMQSLSIFQ